MRKIKIKVSKEELKELHRLGYEIDGYRSIISFMLKDNDNNKELLNQELFKTYIDDFNKTNAEYNKEKNRFGLEVLKPRILKELNLDDVDFKWIVRDFDDEAVEITIED